MVGSVVCFLVVSGRGFGRDVAVDMVKLLSGGMLVASVSSKLERFGRWRSAGGRGAGLCDGRVSVRGLAYRSPPNARIFSL